LLGARVLVAEDDQKQAHLVRVYLERDGHSVHVVSDGRSALERCRAYRPDLVVLDVMMPVVDGLEVLARQGALSFERWTGVPAPLDVMRAAVRFPS